MRRDDRGPKFFSHSRRVESSYTVQHRFSGGRRSAARGRPPPPADLWKSVRSVYPTTF